MSTSARYKTIFGSLIAGLALTLAAPVGAHPLLLLKAKKEAEQSRVAPVPPIPPLVAKSAVTGVAAQKATIGPRSVVKRRPGPPLPPPLTLKAMH
ncbi:hypothetical protein [uncultured Tateyamaria sp.]|uniref:hypothetical protein n=1 Tax=uncultured Tateyamaria sp. TaxID=455651 RepID=UPI0026214116|nr:hypothetical protein [uncultured Tateyamaria sp.]